METLRNLPRDEWEAALDELSAERRGAPVLLVIDWESAGEEVEAHDVLLESLAFDVADDAVEVIARRPSPAGPTTLRHVVDAPRSIGVDAPVGILPSEVHVTAGDGLVTIVRLGAAPAASS